MTHLQAVALEAAANAIVITDRDGLIVWANPAFSRLTGHAPEDAAGQTPRILKSGQHSPDFYATLWRTIRSGAVWHGQLVNRRKDGSLYTEEQTITPVRGGDGEISHFIAIKQDVTEREEAKRALRDRDRLFGALLENARDIITILDADGIIRYESPALSRVLGYAPEDLIGRSAFDFVREEDRRRVKGALEAGRGIPGYTALLREQLQGEPAEDADKIAQAADRCARIVRNFLALARQHPPERKRLAINEVVREAIELLAYPLRVDGVEVAFDLAGDLPPLWGDTHQLHQVMVNLATNAHHAMRGTPPPRRLAVTTRWDPARSRVAIDVADSGPGIAPEILGRIFEPFFTTKPIGQGTGLGLPMCQGIVLAHGGDLRVRSEPGRGATFTVELPVRTGDADREPRSPAPTPPPEGCRVLVVDDEAEIAKVVAEILTLGGHRVETAPNGVVALEKLATGGYDVVVSDLRMPELDGPGLYREVQRRHPELGRRFVFLTGDTVNPETARVVEETGVPSVAKPFGPEELLRAVRRVAPGR